MNLFSAILELKQNIFSTNEPFDADFLISEIASMCDVDVDALVPYYNLISSWKVQESETKVNVPSNTRAWTLAEKELILLYTGQMEDDIGRKPSFREFAKILDRTAKAVELCYYTYKKEKFGDQREEEPTLFDLMEEPNENPYQEMPMEKYQPDGETSKDDLMDSVGGFFENMQKIGNTDLSGLFKGLNQLTALAVGNQESMKKHEKSVQALEKKLEEKQVELEEKLKEKQTEMSKKERRIAELESQMNEMRKEQNEVRQKVHTFDKLPVPQKFSKLKKYTEELLELVGK